MWVLVTSEDEALFRLGRPVGPEGTLPDSVKVLEEQGGRLLVVLDYRPPWGRAVVTRLHVRGRGRGVTLSRSGDTGPLSRTSGADLSDVDAGEGSYGGVSRVWTRSASPQTGRVVHRVATGVVSLEEPWAGRVLFPVVREGAPPFFPRCYQRFGFYFRHWKSCFRNGYGSRRIARGWFSTTVVGVSVRVVGPFSVFTFYRSFSGVRKGAGLFAPRLVKP